jgi:hypothetical protein
VATSAPPTVLPANDTSAGREQTGHRLAEHHREDDRGSVGRIGLRGRLVDGDRSRFTLSKATELSTLVEASSCCRARSVANPAGMLATTVPTPFIRSRKRVVRPEPLTPATSDPPTVLPANETSAAVKPVTASLYTTVKRIGEALSGSDCAAAWLIVTVGFTLSNGTVLSVLVEARSHCRQGR